MGDFHESYSLIMLTILSNFTGIMLKNAFTD
jgi:hypothetical protein